MGMETGMGEATMQTAVRCGSRDTLSSPGLDSDEADFSPHAVERKVCRLLATQPGLNVSGLVVHRLRDGVCLTGVVESIGDETDVCHLVRQVEGVDQVVNRLLVRSGGRG
ncbi:MAG: BON domain-containing protein [Planctomycetaceae bacterium]